MAPWDVGSNKKCVARYGKVDLAAPTAMTGH